MPCFLEFSKWYRLQFWNTRNNRDWKIPNTLRPFFLRMFDFFSKLLTPSSLMAFTNLHSTAFSVFTYCSFFVIIWISTSFGYFVGCRYSYDTRFKCCFIVNTLKKCQFMLDFKCLSTFLIWEV